VEVPVVPPVVVPPVVVPPVVVPVTGGSTVIVQSVEVPDSCASAVETQSVETVPSLLQATRKRLKNNKEKILFIHTFHGFLVCVLNESLHRLFWCSK
jgi:hypothetical protein